jgi:hypothetical protein
MNENVKELVNAMLAKDADKMQAAFQASVAEKISAKLDDMRSSMAQSMFKTQEEPSVEQNAEPVVEEDFDLDTLDQLTEEQLDEVLTKKTPASEYISDFVKSDNPKFEGKSKKERIRMALGAYYDKHPEKSKK